MTFTDPVQGIRGIGDSRHALLEKAGLITVSDLLSYLPYTYEDSTNIIDIETARTVVLKTPVWELSSLRFAIKATLEKAMTIRTRRGLTLVTASFSDSKSDKKIKAVWFNQSYIQNDLKQGSTYVLYGKVQKEGQTFSFSSPKIEQLLPDQPLKKLGGVLPVYRRIKAITSTYMRKYIIEALDCLAISEFLPYEVLRDGNLPELKESLALVHTPKVLEMVGNGYRRLAIQELLELRQDYEEKFIQQAADPAGAKNALFLGKSFGEWIPKLPYELTPGQEKILQSMLEHIQKEKFLDALVYGDVGSGKTIVALLLAFAFAKLGFSAVLIAPTTILASQHIKTATRILEMLNLQDSVSIVPVVAGKSKLGKVTPSSLYIGTQAILHNKSLLNDPIIKFVCIDEQHRFGVEQRNILKKDGRHVVTLSATPIPRTLALSFLGFSEAYMLEDRPKGRKEVVSRLVPHDKEVATYEWMVKHLEAGEQMYVVFPRIESEEESEKQSLLAMAASLKTQYFSHFQSELLYGGLKEEEKNRIMSDFSEGKIRILFSTSVIEVGVDIANATIIAIHGAELFGLAQLHQLRGRVGRSSQQGYCLLFSGVENPEAAKRLAFFSENSKGIAVSEYDLQNRGTGTLLGKQQSGLSELRMAQVTDLSMIKEAMTIFQSLRRYDISIPRYFRVKSQHAEK